MKKVLFGCLILMGVAGCERHEGPAAAGAGVLLPGSGGVVAVNYPLAYWAELLAGDALAVELPVPEDEDPAFWVPDDAAVERMQRAKLILLNGPHFSPWLRTVTLPQERLLDSTAAFGSAFIEVKDGLTHSHGPEGEHSHAGVAFTTWIDFQQAVQQVDAVAEGIERRLPEGQRVGMRQRQQELVEVLHALDQRMLAVGKRLEGMPLLGSHPVYQYLGRRYGLNLVELHWEPDEVPDEAAMAELKKLLPVHAAGAMLWEDDPDARSVALLDALKIRSVVFAPCGNRPEGGDFLSVMEANVKALEQFAVTAYE